MVKCKRPRVLVPGPFVAGKCVDLGDGLETVYGDANREGLVYRNRSADDLRDEVVSGARDPDVASLINRKRVAGVQEGRGLLEAGCGGKCVGTKETDLAEAGAGAVGNPGIRATINGNPGWTRDSCRGGGEGPVATGWGPGGPTATELEDGTGIDR